MSQFCYYFELHFTLHTEASKKVRYMASLQIFVPEKHENRHMRVFKGIRASHGIIFSTDLILQCLLAAPYTTDYSVPACPF